MPSQARLVAALAAFVLAGVFAAPTLAADPPATGRITITPTIDPPGEVGGQAVPHGSRFKIRNSDGKVVAEGGVDGSGGNRGNYQSASVDLPPGDYTVEVYYHTPGDRHEEGTRDYRGDREVKVEPGKTSLQQVEVEPRNPEEHLGDRIQDVEDQITEKDDAIEDLEQDIANHRRNGEPVGDEHTDMLDDLKEDKDALKARLRRMRARLAQMVAERRRQEAARNATKKGAMVGPKNPAGLTHGGEIPQIPHSNLPSGGSKAPRPRGKY
jgi:uncharacterized coiled-coil protein SlyX